MARAQSFESPAPTDRIDGTETQAPAADAITDRPYDTISKSGPGNWGVAARWFLLALLAIAFFFCLTVLRR